MLDYESNIGFSKLMIKTLPYIPIVKTRGFRAKLVIEVESRKWKVESGKWKMETCKVMGLSVWWLVGRNECGIRAGGAGMKKRKTAPYIMGALLILLATAVYFWLSQPELEPWTEEVQRERVESLVEEIGEINAENRRKVVAKRGGEIRKMVVETGDLVEKGTVLVEIDSDDWRTSIQQRSDEISALRNEYQQFLDRGARAEEVEQKVLELAEKQLEEERDQLERIQTLYQAGAETLQQLKAVELEVARLENAVRQAELALKIAEEETSPSAQESYLARIRQLEREKNQLENRWDGYYVQAPVAGTVLRKLVEEGDYIQPGQALYEVGDLRNLYVTAELLTREMQGIELGMPVRIIHRDLGIEPVYGTLRKIDPLAVPILSELGVEQRRVKVEIVLKGQVESWKPGYEVDVEIIKQVQEEAMAIPEPSIFWKDEKPYVRIWKEGKVKERAIETGLEGQGRIEIISGLEVGDLVIMDSF